jgi:hypothetical protein
MNFSRVAMAAATVAACALMVGCAQDTPKSVFQNSDEYADRVFVPSALSDAVQKAVTDGKPMTFNKITFTENAKVIVQGAPVEMSRDVTYENAGEGGLVREIDLSYANGVVTGKEFSLTYRGVVNLYVQDIGPNSQRMPYTRRVSSVSHFDTSFDVPTLSYNYEMRSNAPNGRTVSRSGSCTLTSTYPASKFAAGIQGDAKEFNCKFYNDNGVLDANSDVVYLNTYGVAIVKHMAKTNGDIHLTVSNFKAS